MKPRWLVIAAVLPTQDVMYVQYNVPTVIMSRSCDQLPKASLTCSASATHSMLLPLLSHCCCQLDVHCKLQTSSVLIVGICSGDVKTPHVQLASLDWPACHSD